MQHYISLQSLQYSAFSRGVLVSKFATSDVAYLYLYFGTISPDLNLSIKWKSGSGDAGGIQIKLRGIKVITMTIAIDREDTIAQRRDFPKTPTRQA